MSLLQNCFDRHSGVTGLHLISEEHDIKPPDFKAIPIPIKNLAQVNDLPDEKVAMSAVTVWIDPLDATHEYR